MSCFTPEDQSLKVTLQIYRFGYAKLGVEYIFLSRTNNIAAYKRALNKCIHRAKQCRIIGACDRFGRNQSCMKFEAVFLSGLTCQPCEM